MNEHIYTRIKFLIAAGGFESIGLDEEKREELFNGKCGLHLRKEDIKNCRILSDISRLPISSSDMLRLTKKIYDIGKNYVDNSEKAQFKDVMKGILTVRAEKGVKKVRSGICPLCKTKINDEDNFCHNCRFRLYLWR